MRCQKCGCLEDKVIDSRSSKEGATIRRRRECLQCGHRFTTYEEIEHGELMVVKRDGRREPFSRDKLLNGITKACQKRPVSHKPIATTLTKPIKERSTSRKQLPTKLHQKREKLKSHKQLTFTDTYLRASINRSRADKKPKPAALERHSNAR